MKQFIPQSTTFFTNELFDECWNNPNTCFWTFHNIEHNILDEIILQKLNESDIKILKFFRNSTVDITDDYDYLFIIWSNILTNQNFYIIKPKQDNSKNIV